MPCEFVRPLGLGSAVTDATASAARVKRRRLARVERRARLVEPADEAAECDAETIARWDLNAECKQYQITRIQVH